MKKSHEWWHQKKNRNRGMRMPFKNKADDQTQQQKQRGVQTKPTPLSRLDWWKPTKSWNFRSQQFVQSMDHGGGWWREGKWDKVERNSGLGQLEGDQHENKQVSLIPTHGVWHKQLRVERVNALQLASKTHICQGSDYTWMNPIGSHSVILKSQELFRESVLGKISWNWSFSRSS